MTVTITLGKAGRLVVPKSIRDSLGLGEGSRLNLAVTSGKLEIVPECDDAVIKKSGKRRVISGWQGYDAGEAIRREREDQAARHTRRSSHKS